jgi:hypothetical protein
MIRYTTFDAQSPATDVLRLAFEPTTVRASGIKLERLSRLTSNGYTIEPLSSGDYLITVRHVGLKKILVQGDDPQQSAPVEKLTRRGKWASKISGDELECRFSGNQVRIVGDVNPQGGLADVFIDDAKQRVAIDCWNPSPRSDQILYYLNGLPNGEHMVRVVVRGASNPRAQNAFVPLKAVQWSDATGTSNYGSGGGPTEPQRMVFGYPERTDYVDSEGHAWKPATEWVCRAGNLADVVQQNWWTKRRRLAIENTPDPELYRYGVHAPEVWVNLTVAPGVYAVRLMFAETRDVEPKLRAVTVLVNGKEVTTDLDIATKAGGLNRATDLVFDNIQPDHGVIEIRLRNPHGGEAMIQAIEIGAGETLEGKESRRQNR